MKYLVKGYSSWTCQSSVIADSWSYAWWFKTVRYIFSWQSHLSFILFPALYTKYWINMTYAILFRIFCWVWQQRCLLLTSTLTMWHSRTRSRGDKRTCRSLPLNIRKHCEGNQALAEVTQTDCGSLWDTHRSSGCGLALGDPSWAGGPEDPQRSTSSI